MRNLWTLGSFILATVVTGTPVEHYQNLESRQSSEGVVTGITWRDENGNVPVRREVRDLKDNYPDQWNLYLLGLAAVEWADQNDPLSYYSLASIHGRPFKTWGNAPGIPHKIGTSGYCPHSSSLFLTWHRPYLALFEEQLYKQVRWYASAAPADQAARYAAAADSFRMPYWDWARGENAGTVPEFFTTQKITVLHTDGTNESIWNPLYSFYFHPLTPSEFNDKWSHANSTLRWPISDAPDAVSSQSEFYKSYEEQRRGLHDHIEGAFRRDSMNDFAHTVEEAHGWMHGVIGGGWDGKSAQGHMWPLEYSAFEPLFMLHHTNVDRIFAMYQAAHPDRYFTPQNIGTNGNVFLEDGSTVDAVTSLLPFRHPGGGFWTPNGVRDTRVFGYAYPETLHSNNGKEGEGAGWSKGSGMSGNEEGRGINATIAKLYGVPARSRLQIAGPDTSSSTKFTDWSIRASSTARSTFVARFSFVGDFSSDQSVDVGSWVKIMPSHHSISPAGGVEGEREAEKSWEGRISLTNNLLDAISQSKLASLEPSEVIPFLKSSLTWVILDGDGKTLPTHALDAFAFEVVSEEALVPADLGQPVEYKGRERRWAEVTRGKAGGVQ